LLRIERVRSAWRGINEVSFLPTGGDTTIQEGSSRSYQIAAPPDGWEQGNPPLKRWFFLDGAARVFPLRERYRQRVECIVFWPTRKLYDWRSAPENR
jgi:hypothetical protein